MKNKFLWLISMLVLAFFMAACANPLVSDLAEDDPADDPATDPTPVVDTTYVDGLLAELRADLEVASTAAGVSPGKMAAPSSANNLTADEIDFIITAARAGVESAGQLESKNIAVLLPMILEGAQTQLSQVSSASVPSTKINIIETMVESCVDMTDENVITVTGKQDLIINLATTAVENMPAAGVAVADIDDAVGGAVTAVVASVESVFTIDKITGVITSVTSASVEALSVAYSEATAGDASEIEGAVSFMTSSIITEVQTFTALPESVLGDTIADVSGSVNDSLVDLSDDLSGTVTGLDVTGLASSAIEGVTESLLAVASDSNVEVLKDIIADTIIDMGVAVGDVTGFAQAITTSAVDAAAGAQDVTSVVTGIVESVAEGIATADVTVDTAAITTVISSGLSGSDTDSSGVNTTTAIEEGQTVAANTVPEVELLFDTPIFIVDPGTARTVTATVTATDAETDDASLVYSWDYTGLELTDAQIAAGVTGAVLELKVPVLIGEYAVSVTVDDGIETVTKTVFLLVQDAVETPQEKAVRLVQVGKNAMNGDNFEEALNLFEEAKNADPLNTEAVLYWTVLNIGSTVVDTAVRDIAGSAGMVGYPQTMQEFITGDWMDAMPVSSVDSWENSDGSRTTDIYTHFYPEITIPEGFDSLSYFNVATQADSMLTYDEYIHAVAFNLQKSYPTGFNAPVSSVVSLIKGKLNETVAALSVISGYDSISFDADMFIVGGYDPFTSVWPVDVNGDPIPVVIGESEVLLSMASLQIVNSLLNTVLAVDLDVDLAAFYTAFNLKDGVFWGADYLANQRTYDWNDAIESAYNWGGDLPQYPLETGFLQTSVNADAVMAESKQYMADALGNLSAAIDGILARDGVTTDFTFSDTEMDAAIWDEIVNITKISDIMVDKLATSLNTNSSVTIPMNLFSSDYAMYTNESAWPSAADWSGVTSIYNFDNADIDVNLAAMFEKPLFALDNLIDLKANGEPVIYRINGSTYTPVDTYSAAELAADRLADVKFAVKIKDLTYGGLVSIPADIYENVYLAEMDYTTRNALIQEDNTTVDGTISYYLQLIEPEAVFSALNPALTTNIPDAADPGYVKAAGSFWYALVPMVDDLTSRVYDGNDSVADAEPITTDGVALSRDLTYGDEDFYSFPVTAGSLYKVTINTDYDFVTKLQVRNEADTRSWGGGSWNYDATRYDYSMFFEGYDNGTYTVEVSDSHEIYSKGYTVSVELISPVADGNVVMTDGDSNPLTIDGSAVSSTLNTGDKDYYAVDMIAGTLYNISYTQMDDFRSIVYLYDSTSYQEHSFDIWQNSAGTNVEMFACDNSGTYYLEVKDQYTENEVSYSISVEIFTPLTDGNDSVSDAASNPLGTDGSSISSTLTTGDKDYYSVELTEGVAYGVTMSKNDDFTSWARLYNSSDNQIVSVHNWSGESTGYFRCISSGTYYLEVRDEFTDTEAAYNISIAEVVVQDDGLDINNKHVLSTDGTPWVDSLTLFDEDYYSFDAVSGNTYIILVDATEYFWKYVFLENSSYTHLQNTYGDWDSGLSMTFNCTTDGTYYIRIPELNDDRTFIYNISVTQQ